VHCVCCRHARRLAEITRGGLADKNADAAGWGRCRHGACAHGKGASAITNESIIVQMRRAFSDAGRRLLPVAAFDVRARAPQRSTRPHGPPLRLSAPSLPPNSLPFDPSRQRQPSAGLETMSTRRRICARSSSRAHSMASCPPVPCAQAHRRASSSRGHQRGAAFNALPPNNI
jgi:hypothetical protein